VVGAPGALSPVSASAGQAYVWVRQGATWFLTEELFAPAGAPGDGFGNSVAIEGDILAVGAVGTGPALSSQDFGRVFVFQRVGTSWLLAQQLDPPAVQNPQPGAFGSAVALSGGTLFVGAEHDYELSGGGTGAVYVYQRSGGGAWSMVQKLRAGNFAHDARFGSRLSVSGGALAVGAWKDRFFGAVYVFRHAVGGWFEEAKLVANDPSVAAYLGRSVSINGARLVAGAPELSDQGQPGGPGAAYIFERSAIGWVQSAKLRAQTPSVGSGFGESLALSGSRLLVGAPGQQALNGTTGRVFAFESNGVQWTEFAGIQATQTGSTLNAFGCASLWNGTEVFIGASGESMHPDRAGAAYSFGFLPTVGSTVCDGQSACPCGNVAAFGEGCANSSGVGAALEVFGSSSVVADDLAFNGRVPALRVCILYAGARAPGSGNGTPRGDGLLCLGGSITALAQSRSDLVGSISFGAGHASLGAWQPGETRAFQLWYRDPQGPCGKRINSTNAIEVQFTP
jgi:hypothetical protein